MKKQIVIKLSERDRMWCADLHGIVDNKKTDNTGTGYFADKSALFTSIQVTHIPKIEKWMEQIG